VKYLSLLLCIEKFNLLVPAAVSGIFFSLPIVILEKDSLDATLQKLLAPVEIAQCCSRAPPMFLEGV
jgi:hypothetical protein